MDSDSPFAFQPPIFTADFVFTIIFILISFVQLVLVFILTSIKLARKPWNSPFGTITEQEVGLLRIHRPRYALLMTLTLLTLIIVYATQAASMFYGFIPYPTYLAILVANSGFSDIQNVFFSAVLISLLDTGIKVSQLRRYGTTANSWQGGTNVNIIVLSCLVGFLMVLTIGRVAVFGLWNAELTGTGPSATTAAEWWAQFGMAQVRIFIDVVFAIYYTVVAISMWRKARMVPSEPNEADKNHSFRVLERISKILCPVLILSTVSMIIFDILGNTIATTTRDIYFSFNFANDFISGAIAVLLNLAIISIQLKEVLNNDITWRP